MVEGRRKRSPSGGEDDDEDENTEVVYSKTASVQEVEEVKSGTRTRAWILMSFKGMHAAKLNSVMMQVFLHHQLEGQHRGVKAKMA